MAAPQTESHGVLADETGSNHNSLVSSPDKANGVQIVTFDGPSDKRNPYNWSETKKWLVAGMAMLGTLTLTLNGTSITIAADQIAEQFHIADTATFTHTYWTTTSWTLGGAVFIIVGLPLMEDIGVQAGFLTSYILFLLFVIPQAVATNYATLVVSRFFSGGLVALCANTISSIIPDLWATDKARSFPVSIYIVCYLVGSTLGPVLFAGVVQATNSFRWIFYIQLILYGTLLPFYILILRETRPNIILRRIASRLQKSSPPSTSQTFTTADDLSSPGLIPHLLTSIRRPMYLLFTEPVLAASTLWSAFAFGTVFVFTQSVEQVFQSLYGWSAYTCGYIQGAVVIGELLGWLVSLPSIRIYLASASRNTESPGTPIPEARLYVSVAGSFIGITGGMFVYAWTSSPFLPWIAPATGLLMVGFGIQVVVSAVADYVTDAYAESGYAGSAISAVAAGENVIAGLLPLATQSMYTNLGFRWASTLIGFLALGVTFAPVVFIWKGRTLRERSPFMKSAGKRGGVAVEEKGGEEDEVKS
ncbi:uncharacterized protein MYCGRDRAFT_69159 [Zymoseptoria tritici IPO323]|uniref:Major facilitator superfamily (MFS) profile domain-containing protein n=1 Tax=Zymoseptoria tritici (strain CBS 115943 / IPO323) TaxID=336722 RepID=F9X4Y2_ZYMTI|nr:uncharacterized protein MYCGRDRAFT_69159 [Zymoseptoria tritici IPO323]EGP90189.1 hypothetical protein MYCGRDRAFT_69159 [Zymoseptoria tritici IPO323]